MAKLKQFDKFIWFLYFLTLLNHSMKSIYQFETLSSDCKGKIILDKIYILFYFFIYFV